MPAESTREQTPGYVALARSGELRRRVDRLTARLTACDLCPRRCGVDRRRGPGACGVGERALLASAVPHHGEEPVLSGTRGAGGLFLAGCNLRCSFCQNYQVSRVSTSVSPTVSPAVFPTMPAAFEPDDTRSVREVDARSLADAMLSLQRAGCHNLDIVSGSHVVPQLLGAIEIAAREGLTLPIVWNSNAYEPVDVLRALDGVVDVYLPDLKYAGDGMAQRFSGVRGYVATSRAALREMDRQVGPLVLDDDGLARRGLIVRHLVLPRNVAGTASCLRFVAEHLSPGVAVSLMAQYAPAAEAVGDAILGRGLTHEEYDRAVSLLDDLGLEHGWVQSLEESPEHYRPDFDRDHPFEL